MVKCRRRCVGEAIAPSEASSKSSHRITNSSPTSRARVSPGRSRSVSRFGNRHEQLVADLVTVGVVDLLEVVEIGEQDRRQLVPDRRLRRTAWSSRSRSSIRFGSPVSESCSELCRKRIGGVPQIGAGLRVDQVRSRHIGQRLRHGHGFGVQRPGAVPVEVERAEWLVIAVAEREGEHRRQPRRHARGAKRGNCRSSRRSGMATAWPRLVRREARAPRPARSAAARSAAPPRSRRRRSAGRSSGEMRVTPAAVIGMTSTIRSTRWSRIDWIGKSVTIVRANSLSTSERCSLRPTISHPYDQQAPQGLGGTG